MHFTEEFRKYYSKTFRPQAEKCANGFQMIVSIERGEKQDETNVMFQHIKNCNDSSAIWFIGLLIGDVDMALIKGKRLNTINSASAVHGCLTSDSYWTNVWSKDQDSDEYKNLKVLSTMLDDFIRLFSISQPESTRIDIFDMAKSLSKSDGAKEFFKNVNTYGNVKL